MSQTTKACLWMIGAILSFSTMAIAGRLVSVELDTFEIMTYRSLFGIVLVCLIAGAAGTLRDVTTDRLGLHLIRNLFHFSGQNLWFAALTMIPLAQLFAVEFTSPIWVLLLAPLILGEALTRRKLGYAALGFVGILIVARPWLSPDTGSGAQANLGLLLAALAAIGFAGSILLTKKLTETASITCILFYLTTMQAVFGLICGFADGTMALPSAATLPGVLAIGAAGLMAHYCLTTAVSLAPATVVVPIDFARLPLIAFVGMAYFNEPLDPWVFVGGSLIFLANYLNILAATRKSATNM